MFEITFDMAVLRTIFDFLSNLIVLIAEKFILKP